MSKEEFAQVQAMLANPKAFIADRPAPSSQANKVRERIVNGERRSNAVPYGYSVKGGVWEINPETADVVRMIYDMTVKGLSSGEICIKLRELAIPTLSEYRRISKGEKFTPTNYWKQQAVKDILQDEQYIGTYVAGKTYGDTDGRKFNRPKSEWIIIPDMRPAIIDKEVFAEVQKIRSQSRKNMRKRDYLLSGKVSCGCCGYALYYSESTNPPTYRCAHTHADTSAACYKMKCRSDELEDAVMTVIKKQAEVVLNSDDLSGFRKTSVGGELLNGSVVPLNNDVIKQQINMLSKERQECYERFINLEIDRDTFQTQKADYTK